MCYIIIRTHFIFTFQIYKQHDVLFKRLTVREHLQLLCRLKGVPSRLIKQEVDQSIAAIGIKDKENDFPPSLSGGQTLIGGSKIVF